MLREGVGGKHTQRWKPSAQRDLDRQSLVAAEQVVQVVQVVQLGLFAQVGKQRLLLVEFAEA